MVFFFLLIFTNKGVQEEKKDKERGERRGEGKEGIENEEARV